MDSGASGRCLACFQHQHFKLGIRESRSDGNEFVSRILLRKIFKMFDLARSGQMEYLCICLSVLSEQNKMFADFMKRGTMSIFSYFEIFYVPSFTSKKKRFCSRSFPLKT